MTQKTSRRKRARIRKRRKVARCIPSRNSSPRSNSRRSNPFSSNKQRPSSTGRRKCRVRLSNRRRRRSPHGDTGWISSVARRRLSGKTTKVSLSTTRNFTLSYVDSHDVSTQPRTRSGKVNRRYLSHLSLTRKLVSSFSLPLLPLPFCIWRCLQIFIACPT